MKSPHFPAPGVPGAPGLWNRKANGGLLWGNLSMEAPAEVGVARTEQDGFAHEDPKMEKRSGWAPGSALDFHKPNREQTEGIGVGGPPRSGWVEAEDIRSGDLLRRGKPSTPASAASGAGKMVIIREARSKILKATPAENRGRGDREGGAARRPGERSPSPGPSPPQPAPQPPSTSPGRTRRRNGAAGRQGASLTTKLGSRRGPRCHRAGGRGAARAGGAPLEAAPRRKFAPDHEAGERRPH